MNIEEMIHTIASTYNLREWKATPHGTVGNSFFIDDNTGRQVCILVFPEDADPGWVNLITSAPELKIIAGVCLRLLEETEAPKKNVFLKMVREILRDRKKAGKPCKIRNDAT